MTYEVKAVRWDHGWELHIKGIGVTQSRTLAEAESMVRDYLELDDQPDAATAQVVIRPDLGGVESVAYAARQKLSTAQVAQAEAARASREAVKALLGIGLSTSDAAAVMGVSKSRVSQLAHHASRKAG